MGQGKEARLNNYIVECQLPIAGCELDKTFTIYGLNKKYLRFTIFDLKNIVFKFEDYRFEDLKIR